MKTTFIVNGTETIVTTKGSTLLINACKKALEQTGNTARPVTDFQPILGDNFLTFENPINRQWLKTNNGRETDTPLVITEDSVIFLSLKAGQGA
jgi:hypothetical protein